MFKEFLVSGYLRFRRTHHNAGRMYGQVSLACEPRLGTGILARMRVSDAEEPLDALFYGALEDFGCFLYAFCRL